MDPTRPGDFSSPEAILDQPTVVQALAELESRGLVLSLSLEDNPPDTSGLYRREDLTGIVLDSSDGQAVGTSLYGTESRVEQAGSTRSGASVNFNQNQPVGYGISNGSFIRGGNTAYSTYSTGSTTCTEGGAEFTISSVTLASGELDLATGDRFNVRSISLTVDTSGQSSTECLRAYSTRASVGGWTLFEYAQIPSVTIDSIQYMCVDNTNAYAPTESWVREDGVSCECSVNYEEVCEI